MTLALLLTGCAALPAVPADSDPVALVVRAESTGGLCPSDAPCGSQLVVLSDGTWSRVEGEDETSGTLGEARLAALVDAVERTGLATAPAFTGTCPIAYDGQEQVLSWLEDGVPVSVSSCERQFDPADPLVRAVAGLAAELA